MATILHDSDCATHNEPAIPNGPCDCGAAWVERVVALATLYDADAERIEKALHDSAKLAALASSPKPPEDRADEIKRLRSALQFYASATAEDFANDNGFNANAALAE